MRILFWHGYLLEGTGSNIYTRAVAREWGRAGHDVVVFCQDPAPERFDLAGAEVVRPELDTRLPTFVIDRYEGLEPVLLQDMPGDERERYVRANAAAVRERLPADLVFANHVVMGGPVAAATGGRFAVKAHGSELEYSMRGNAELEELGATSLRGAGAVFVGSDHIRGVLHDVVGEVERVHEVPPGVDVDQFVVESREDALAGLLAECRADPPNPGNRQERLPDEGNERRLREFLAGDAPTVLYFGKLLYNKGVHVLLEALRGMDVARGRRRLRRLPPRAGADGAPTDAVHGPARAPPPRPPDPARRRRRRAVDLPGGIRHGRRRGRGRGLSAAGRAALGARGDRPRDRGRLSRRDFGTWRASRRATPLDLARKLHGLLALPAATRAELGKAARRVAVEHWSWAGVARRLLEPFE